MSARVLVLALLAVKSARQHPTMSREPGCPGGAGTRAWVLAARPRPGPPAAGQQHQRAGLGAFATRRAKGPNPNGALARLPSNRGSPRPSDLPVSERGGPENTRGDMQRASRWAPRPSPTSNRAAPGGRADRGALAAQAADGAACGRVPSEPGVAPHQVPVRGMRPCGGAWRQSPALHGTCRPGHQTAPRSAAPRVEVHPATTSSREDQATCGSPRVWFSHTRHAIGKASAPLAAPQRQQKHTARTTDFLGARRPRQTTILAHLKRQHHANKTT